MTRPGDIENARSRQLARAALVPGLVDGLVTTAVDQDGSISVHLVIGTSETSGEDCPHIELVLKREHAGILGELLLGVRRPRVSPADGVALPIPCCIGISLNFVL